MLKLFVFTDTCVTIVLPIVNTKKYKDVKLCAFFPCISGGHLNPAVTLGLTAVGRLRPVLLPVYWAGQYLGAFLAALVLWGVYSDAILLVGTVNTSYTLPVMAG
jgi:glycerol uptake facilitator-like aquaporin